MTKIPKIIHQIWFQGESNIPDKYQLFRKSWKDNHPDWSHFLWDESNIDKFIQGKYPDLWDLYSNFPHMHQKIDLFKYIVLYDLGGVYADMDSESLKSLNGLLLEFPEASVIISEASGNFFEHLFLVGNKKMLNNGVILSKAKHPFFKYLIHTIKNTEKCSSNQSKVRCIENTTGPKIFTNSCYLFKNNNEDTSDLFIISPEYLEPCFGLDDQCKISANSYVNHQHSLTWLGDFQIKLIKFYIQTKKYLLFILIIILVYYFYKNNK